MNASPRDCARCVERARVRTSPRLDIAREGELIADQRRRVEALPGRVVDEVGAELLLDEMKCDAPRGRLWGSRSAQRRDPDDNNRDRKDGCEHDFHKTPSSLNRGPVPVLEVRTECAGDLPIRVRL